MTIDNSKQGKQNKRRFEIRVLETPEEDFHYGRGLYAIFDNLKNDDLTIKSQFGWDRKEMIEQLVDILNSIKPGDWNSWQIDIETPVYRWFGTCSLRQILGEQFYELFPSFKKSKDNNFEPNEKQTEKTRIEISSLENQEPKVEINKQESNNKKDMREITPKVIETFTLEERKLFKAGLLDENKNWTELARDLIIEITLRKNQEDLTKLADELIKEEREDMFIGIFKDRNTDSKKEQKKIIDKVLDKG